MVIAGIGIGVVGAAAAADAVERIGACGDSLRLERLFFKRGGHFRAQHAEKIRTHVHLLHLAPDQNAQKICAVAFARGGRFTGRNGGFAVGGGSGGAIEAACRRPGEDPDEADEQKRNAKELFQNVFLLADGLPQLLW